MSAAGSTSAIPPGHCGIHGYHGRAQCPKCSTSALSLNPILSQPEHLSLPGLRAENAALRATVERQREALERIAQVQPDTLAMIEHNGFVFRTPLGKPDEDRTEAERWEKLAFSIYTRLCEVDAVVRDALKDAGGAAE